MKRTFLGYGRQEVDDADIAAVIDTLKSDFLTQGPAVERFESALAERVGARHAVAVAEESACSAAAPSLRTTQRAETARQRARHRRHTARLCGRPSEAHAAGWRMRDGDHQGSGACAISCLLSVIRGGCDIRRARRLTDKQDIARRRRLSHARAISCPPRRISHASALSDLRVGYRARVGYPTRRWAVACAWAVRRARRLSHHACGRETPDAHVGYRACPRHPTLGSVIARGRDIRRIGRTADRKRRGTAVGLYLPRY